MVPSNDAPRRRTPPRSPSSAGTDRQNSDGLAGAPTTWLRRASTCHRPGSCSMRSRSRTHSCSLAGSRRSMSARSWASPAVCSTRSHPRWTSTGPSPGPCVSRTARLPQPSEQPSHHGLARRSRRSSRPSSLTDVCHCVPLRTRNLPRVRGANRLLSRRCSWRRSMRLAWRPSVTDVGGS
jgi:hypothetical protein